jgi:hypothetical protein
MSGNTLDAGGALHPSSRLWRAWLLGWISGVTVVAVVYVLLR